MDKESSCDSEDDSLGDDTRSTMSRDESEATDVQPAPCLACSSVTSDILPNESKKIFERFCKLFQVKPKLESEWWDLDAEPVPFCGECLHQISQLLRVRKMLREVRMTLRAGVKEFKDMCKASENKFKEKEIYEWDKRYNFIRQQLTGAEPQEKFVLEVDLQFADPEQSVEATSISNLNSDGGSECYSESVTTIEAEEDVEDAPLHYNATTRKCTYKQLEFLRLENGFYRCLTCNATRRLDKNKIKSHVNRCHLKSTVCTECGEETSSLVALRIHRKKVHHCQVKGSPKVVDCPICGRPFGCGDRMRRHKFTHYSEQDLEEAKKSGEKILTWKDLHSIQCSKCTKTFNSKSKLKSHENANHGPNAKSPATCDNIHKQSVMKTTVLPENSLSCINDVLKHILEKPSTATAAQLNQKSKRIEPDRQPDIGSSKQSPEVNSVTCTTCGALFATRYHLRIHTLKAHPPQTPVNSKQAVKRKLDL